MSMAAPKNCVTAPVASLWEAIAPGASATVRHGGETAFGLERRAARHGCEELRPKCLDIIWMKQVIMPAAKQRRGLLTGKPHRTAD